MHACPPGYAMTGIRVDRNQLACTPVSDAQPNATVDGSNGAAFQRSGMHACPRGFVSGIHVDNNLLLCGVRPVATPPPNPDLPGCTAGKTQTVNADVYLCNKSYPDGSGPPCGGGLAGK